MRFLVFSLFVIAGTIGAGLLSCDHVTTSQGRHDPIPDGGLPPWESVMAPKVNFNAVSGSAWNDVVMVGAKGTIARWNGLKLQTETSGTDNDLTGVWVVSKMLAYAVGAKGTVVRWDGKAWTAESTGGEVFLTAVWADDNDAFAVGEKATALHRAGGAWGAVTVEGQEDLFAITDAGDVLAFGALGTIERWDGKAFKRQSIKGFVKPFAGATSGPGGSYAVGLDGATYRVGGGFDAIEGAPPSFLRAVAAPGGTLWVVGWDGVIARHRGGDFFVYPKPSERWLNGVWAASDDEVWVVGASGAVYHGPPERKRDAGVMP